MKSTSEQRVLSQLPCLFHPTPSSPYSILLYLCVSGHQAMIVLRVFFKTIAEIKIILSYPKLVQCYSFVSKQTKITYQNVLLLILYSYNIEVV